MVPCRIRSRSRSKQVRIGSGSSATARCPAPAGRVAPGRELRILELLAGPTVEHLDRADLRGGVRVGAPDRAGREAVHRRGPAARPIGQIRLVMTHGSRIPTGWDKRPVPGQAVVPGPPSPSAACAAARRASGTRYGEHDT